MKVAFDYGKSMYGGWYLNYYDGGVMMGVRFDTRKEVLEFVRKNDMELPIRRDNE